ncbi:hypothetical protein HGG72_07780 [Ochrobactrum pecoris]|uniref:Uncharacterized protein n=1 Tax=Brucella pecoris TaxID=867683 RepID=A0A5C5CJP1_9HYPH|nr:hypothetical protein [Brucella pecoris]MBB4094776.1 hypothetical protein [Brucella pecoris]NKW80245.1 hypothetical protein [Brucella pecoris]TNV11287.1 hypothetical protein FIB18_14015 [Brucella pecoris]
MIEIFNGVKGEWQTIPAVGLPAGYSIKVFVPSGKTIDSVRNATYRAIKGDKVLYEGKIKKRAELKIQQDDVDQRRKNDDDPNEPLGGPRIK